MSNENIHELILNTYDAIAQTEKWQSILDLYSDTFNLMGCNIFCVDDMEFDANASFFSTSIERLIPKYIDDDIAKLEQGLSNSVRDLQIPYEFVPEEKNLSAILEQGINTKEEIEKIHSWMRKHGIFGRGTYLLNKYDNFHDWITLQFKESGSYLSTNDKQCIDLLAPHIAKVMQVNRPFFLLQKRFNAVFNVLDRFKLGVLIVNQGRSVVLQNRSAERILEHGDCYSVSINKRINFIDNAVNQGVDTIISSFQSSSGLPVNPVYHVIEKQNQDAHYFIETSRLDGSEFGDESLFLIVIMDTSHNQIVNIAGLVTLYKLSAAEEAVAQLLIDGRANNEISEIRGVSIETIRTQVKSIFQKTNVNKRSDLIRLAHSINIPVDIAD